MREIKLIEEAIKNLRLNLKGLSVFTEAASNHYKWTPIIAAMARADKTYAIAKNSKYGKNRASTYSLNLISMLAI